MRIPTLSADKISIRGIRIRDARALEAQLIGNRAWLRPWEATNPQGQASFDVRAAIRSLNEGARADTILPFVIEYAGELVGQVNVSSLSYGSLSSASIGYWVAERFAGRGVVPTAVALATDYCFFELGLHRIEICIRPENRASLRVVEKLGFRYEGLRRRYIHIDGDWRDHFCFAMLVEEVPRGVYSRFAGGQAPESVARIPEDDLRRAALPLRYG